MIDLFKNNFQESKELLDKFICDDKNFAALENAGKLLVSALNSGNKIISCGNGGSMCDAMHFAEELTGRFKEERKAIPAISISDPSHITCVANDYGFEFIFSRFVEALGKKGDILFAISTSGNSINIVNAALAAQKQGLLVIALTGNTGGKLAGISNVEIRVPYEGYSDKIQEIHIKIIHALIHYIEKSMVL
jgi:D-sedoheptulose 7-phosphate isomerase